MRIAKRREVRDWPVVVKVPRDGGTVEEAEFRAHFLLLTRSELVGENGAGAMALLGGGRTDRTLELLQKHVLGWSELEDESGADVPYSLENLTGLVEELYIHNALVAALLNASRGEAEKKIS